MTLRKCMVEEMRSGQPIGEAGTERIRLKVQDMVTFIGQHRANIGQQGPPDCAPTSPPDPPPPPGAMVAPVCRHRPTHRGGLKHRQGKEQLDIFFSNITYMSDKAAAYLGGLQADVWFAAETHIASADFGAAARPLLTQRRTVIAEPVPSTDTDSYRGTWGGVMGSIKTHIATSPTLGNRVDARGQVISSHVDLAAFTVQLRTTNVIIMAAYCRGGDYTRTLRQAAEITRNGASPFMILADWNVVPAALEEDELLHMMDAEVIRPAAITCHQGAGRTIDMWSSPASWPRTCRASR